MQDDCRPAFARAAAAWGWRRVTMDDASQEDIMGCAVGLIEDDALR